ncbi:MAG: GNAT family N-acetyltransferase [Acidimicrobiales bacterium]
MADARVATLADIDSIVALARDGLDEQRDARGGSILAVRETRSAPYELSLREAISDPDAEVFVACIDEVVLGYLAVRAEHLRSGDALGVIDDIFVEPEAREVGLGEAMVELAVEWCRQRQCIGIDAHALPGNRATKNFFESFGFKARLLVVHRPLL